MSYINCIRYMYIYKIYVYVYIYPYRDNMQM